MKPFLALIAFLAATLAFADKPTLAISPVIVSPSIQRQGQDSDQDTPEAFRGIAKKDTQIALDRVTDSLQQQLITAFGDTGKFNVVARTDLPAIVQEQVLGQSGNISASSSAKQGDIKGASYVLVTGIIDFDLYVERAAFKSISRLIERDILRVVAVSRIYDSSTGELVAGSEDTVSAQDFQEYFTFAAREGDLESGIYSQLGNSLANDIATNIANQLFPAKVVAKTGDQITINRGSSNSYYSTNEVVSIFALGEPMMDPDSGESLGVEEIFLGKATIIRINERTTIAMLIEDNGVQAGHIVRQ